MSDWLSAATDYLPGWLDLQRRALDLPGVAFSVAQDGVPVLEWAAGVADLTTGEALTPRHRFRVASHSKTFTAAGILRLRDAGRLSLDDAAGRHVPGLHPEVAVVTLAQLLAHGAGLIRNGPDSAYWSDARPFYDAAELRRDLAEAPILPADTRFKYSNHGYALLGLVIEAVTGEPYPDWIAREVVATTGLHETQPDGPPPPGTPFARGHTQHLPLHERLTIPGDNATHAAAAATGFVSTAADLVRFMAALSPDAAHGPVSVAGRRAMLRRHWRCPHVPYELHYGLGTMQGTVEGWDWFGHSGSFQGYTSRTVMVPARGVSASLLVNAVAAPVDLLMGGVLAVLATCHARGAPVPALADWRGRWWGSFGPVDLLPLGDRVLLPMPLLLNPVDHAAEVTVHAPDRGTISLAPGFGSHGEPVTLERDADGAVAAVHLAGHRLLPEAAHAAALRARYGVSANRHDHTLHALG